MATNFRAKLAKVIHSSLWHSETDWDFAMLIGALTAAMIWLHRVKTFTFYFNLSVNLT